ncbi:MAG TPA: hypothetical protein VM890_00645 [Longimicrobium sp.]|nr:hypothetical protein [Longimicrobium sp.]
MSSHRLRASTLACLLALSLGACFSWRRGPVASPEPDRFVGGPVRVTRTGGPPIVLVGVTIGRDSLYGNQHAKPHHRVAIPVSEVRMLEEPRVNPLATVGLVVLLVTAAVAVVATFLTHTVTVVD